MEANKILLQRKFARIIESLAKEAHITEEEAMGLFYTSKTVFWSLCSGKERNY